MEFTSLKFTYFFIAIVIVFFSLPHKFRWLFLLVASYFFYMSWNPFYGLLLITTTVSIYGSALLMHNRQPALKRLILIAALIINLGILFYFKYTNFLIDTLKGIFSLLNMDSQMTSLKIILPVGISFYTFQALGYCIDVYRGNKTPERHFGKFALFVSFFPLILAGPIERSGRLLPQFEQKKEFDYDRIVDGMLRICFGLIKKMVIADHLALYINTVYGTMSAYSGMTVLFAVYFFPLQLYCDFSGYSDMAIGTAKILGYDIMENFKQPFRSVSIAEFWRRWHIALQSWFRDYLYLSLGGNRVTRPRWYFNIMVVFVLSGLWHGAQWTFVIWGGLHGLFMCVGAAAKEIRQKIAAMIFGATSPARSIALTVSGIAVVLPGCFLPLIWYGPHPQHLIYIEQVAIAGAGIALALLGFIKGFKQNALGAARKYASIFLIYNLIAVSFTFFRAAKIEDAWHAVTHMFQPHQVLKLSQWFLEDFRKYEFNLTVVMIIILAVIDSVEMKGELRKTFIKLPWPVRWALYALMTLGILFFGSLVQSKFIYFNF